MPASVAETSGLINSFIEEGVAAARILAARRMLEIELVHIENALVEVYGLSEATDLVSLRLGRNEMVSELAAFDFRHYFPVLLAELTLENSIIPPEVPRRLEEQTVRCHG